MVRAKVDSVVFGSELKCVNNISPAFESSHLCECRKSNHLCECRKTALHFPVFVVICTPVLWHYVTLPGCYCREKSYPHKLVSSDLLDAY